MNEAVGPWPGACRARIAFAIAGTTNSCGGGASRKHLDKASTVQAEKASDEDLGRVRGDGFVVVVRYRPNLLADDWFAEVVTNT